jgi:hypothetical protein
VRLAPTITIESLMGFLLKVWIGRTDGPESIG